jgi:hypothetical protein
MLLPEKELLDVASPPNVLALQPSPSALGREQGARTPHSATRPWARDPLTGPCTRRLLPANVQTGVQS